MRFPSGLLLGLAVFFALSLPARAARMCSLLLHNINSHDTVYKDVHLPEDLESVLKEVDSEKYFALARTVWDEDQARSSISAVTEAVESGGQPSATQMARLKNVRVEIRLLRSVFDALDQDHEAPETIDQLTTVMGHLQDDFTFGNHDMAAKDASRLDKLATKKAFKKIDEELDNFHPAKNKSFRKWMRGAADTIQDSLDKDQVNSKEFHGMRKLITQVLGVVDVINSTEATVESRLLGRYLSSLNTRMGEVHDVHVAQALKNGTDESDQMLKVPNDIRGYLQDFISAIGKN